MLHFVGKLITFFNFVFIIGLRLYKNNQSVKKIGLPNIGWKKKVVPSPTMAHLC